MTTPTTCAIHTDTTLVCPKCLAIERGRQGGKMKKGSGKRGQARDRESALSEYSYRDALKVFQDSPASSFNSAALLALAPPEKQENAKKYVFRRIQYLFTQGYIERVNEGEYRLVPPR